MTGPYDDIPVKYKYLGSGKATFVLKSLQFECSRGLTRRNLKIDNCTEFCDRSYHLYLPTAACVEDAIGSGLLPLVFAVPKDGGSPEDMMHWVEIAEKYHFILVIPDGLHNSFNGGNCCGYSRQIKLDDVSFLYEIIYQLNDEVPFVTNDLVYAIGWSNGGYLVTHAAKLFRAIAPVAGYQVDPSNDVTVYLPKPTAIFLHHSQDDEFVRITGCCNNSTMPKCCCAISDYSDTCVSAEMKMLEWAGPKFNACNNNQSSPVPQITRKVPGQLTCYTYQNCVANTSYCIHQNKGHFLKPSFEKAFDMSIDVANFFGEHACHAYNRGTWTEVPGEQPRCVCQIEPNGKRINQKYCAGGTLFELLREGSSSHLKIIGGPQAEKNLPWPVIFLISLFLSVLLSLVIDKLQARWRLYKRYKHDKLLPMGPRKE